jgi:pSer/pThr/pTyr-binding forkhead associated (FHA) protein
MARLVISDGSTTKNVELTDAVTVAGRAPENKIVIDDKQSSRRHFTIERIEFGYKLVDLESRNGTRVNDRQVNQMLLRPGDKIQIGKHVLTFEDPNFKEPPADVAARLAPPPAPSKGAEAAAAAAPEGSPALPVAVEAPRPLPLPPISAPAPIDYRTKRNPSGHTTAVQKNVHHQLQEEQKTLTMVAIGAGVFIFVVLVLIFIPSTPSGGGDAGAAKSGPKIPVVNEQERIAKEQEAWKSCRPTASGTRTRPRRSPKSSRRWTSSSEPIPGAPTPRRRATTARPAINGIKTSKNAAFTEAEKLAVDDLKRSDFANALRKIRELLVKYKTDADIHERLAKLKDQAVNDAKSYFTTKTVEADTMKFSRKDEAREIYESILKVMGNGSVPELDDYCKIARVSIEGLQ